MKTERVGLRIGEQERAQLEAIAELKGVSLSQIIREAIDKYLEEAQDGKSNLQ